MTRRPGRPGTARPAVGHAGLAVFHAPASVAVVGASADPSKWGYWLARGALAGRDRRAVHLVNRRGGQIQGVAAAATLSDLDDVPELVAFCVPAEQVRPVVDEALALGVRGLLGITAGVPRKEELAARIAAGGARLIGPASLGLFDAATRLHLAWGDFTPGALAIVSQSGQVGSEIAGLAELAGVGVSRFVSVGSQLDVTVADLLTDLAGHELTRAVAVYLESFTDGRRVFDAIRALRAAGKPVVLLAAGGSEAGQRAARSHTGALATPVDLIDAACRAAGTRRVHTPAELVHVAAYLLTARTPAGHRVAIVSDSGGQGVLAADCLSRRGLAVPKLTPPLAAALAARLPGDAATANPVDLAGAGERDLGTYRDVTAALLASGEVDSVLLSGYFGRYGLDSPALAGAERAVAAELGDLVDETGRPLIVHSMGAATVVATDLRDTGIPVYGTVEAAADALRGAVTMRASPRQPIACPARATAAPAVLPLAATPSGAAGYWAARALLQQAGVVFKPARQVSNRQQVAEAAGKLAAPYVLKAAWLDHKSESGGVRVGLTDAAAAVDSFTEMHGRLGGGQYILEEQDTRGDVIEMIIGARRDPGLGPMVTVGAGGVEAELYRDVATECAPVDLPLALAMIQRLRCAPLLAGWRGRPVADLTALARAVVSVSELVARLPGHGTEIEINPVRVGADGVIAVDALFVPADGGRAGTPVSGTAREHR